MVSTTDEFLRTSVCNGHLTEQALIRRWWHKAQGSRGRIVWEYCLNGSYADAVWFPDSEGPGEECPGQSTKSKYPISGRRVWVCEAKLRLVPELIGQALVYRELAKAAGGHVEFTIVFAETGAKHMVQAAEALGLKVVLGRAV